VGLGGLEPPTSSLSVKRSNHLSYRPERALLSLIHPKWTLKPGEKARFFYLVVGEANGNAACDLSDHVENHRVKSRKGCSENDVHNRQCAGERHNSR
jgi:hypothetical protein